MPLKTLQSFFGYQSFRPSQNKIINSILNKNDTLAILPTGGGKSICFQIPGLIFPGSTIVVSPLISLMKDQVDGLQKKGISATYLNSSLDSSELESRLGKMRNQQYKFIYVAPERLENKKFLSICKKININFVVIDEAHCISMWGHDFRKPYRSIPDFIKQLKTKPVIAAFTATATNDTQKDIIQSLQLIKPNKLLGGFARSNLTIIINSFYSQIDKQIRLLDIIKTHKNKPGIIYTSTRKSAEFITKLLQNYSWSKEFNIPKVDFYHGGLENKQRSKIQDDFISGKTDLIVATNAFGMGVDKSDVRFVVHYHIPGNIENYYQEIGRAGRDGEPSICYLLFHPQNTVIQIEFIKKIQLAEKEQSEFIRNHKFNQLKHIINYSQSHQCHHQKILKFFGEKTHSCKNRCNSCKREIKTTSKFKNKLVYLIKHLSDTHKTPIPKILTKQQIELFSLLRPMTKNNLLTIPGIGNGWIQKWHSTFLKHSMLE